MRLRMLMLRILMLRVMRQGLQGLGTGIVVLLTKRRL